MRLRRRRRSMLSRFAVRFIDTYRRDVSPRVQARCALRPTCSEYGRQAFLDHGVLTATRLTLRRLRRCRLAGKAVRESPAA